MIKQESNCVSCQLPCLFMSCPYYKTEAVCCDRCGDPAVYNIDGMDYCESCAAEELDETFRSLSVKEMADTLDVDINIYR